MKTGAMSSMMNKAYSAENFRKKGHKLIDQLADYLSRQQEGKGPVFKKYDPDSLFEDWQAGMHAQEESFISTTEKILSESIHLHHPNFMGHQVSTVLPEAALADLVGAVMNNGVGVYEMGSPTVAMERAVIKQLAGQLGFDAAAADGFLTSGGTLGNLTALLAARQVMSGTDVWEQGKAEPQYAFMVSEQAHYCIDRAVRIMGWGSAGIVEVPVDRDFRMDPSALEAKFEEAMARDVHIIGVVGSACSTATGSFDPLDEIAAFCSSKKLWFHVDAAHGGSAAYSPKYKPLLKGIEQADSVIVDFHKMLMSPALVTGVLFKDGDYSYQTFTQKAKYLWEKEEKEWFHLGKRTFECTKDMMALKVYLTLQQYGTALWQEIVETLFGLGQRFAELIKEKEDFELAVDPQCNIVCFRHIPDDDRDIDEHNRQLRKKLISEGHFFLVQTELEGTVYLRTALMNVNTTKEQLSALLDRLRLLEHRV